MKIRLLLIGLIMSVASPLLRASDNSGAPPATGPASKVSAGPFEVIMIDMDFLQGVTYMDDRIYLKRQPNRLSEAITLRASMLMGQAYRKWHNGEYDLVSPENAGHAPDSWTDWVQTSANFVEYWVGDKKILHLKRTHS